MPTYPQPISLIESKGKKHLGREEVLRRKIAEEFLDVEKGNINAPDFLSAKQKRKFERYAAMLDKAGILKELDVECLAAYVISSDQYFDFTKKMNNENDPALLQKYTSAADKAFNQMHKCEIQLGLTPVSRVKLAMQTAPKEEDDEL